MKFSHWQYACPTHPLFTRSAFKATEGRASTQGDMNRGKTLTTFFVNQKPLKQHLAGNAFTAATFEKIIKEALPNVAKQQTKLISTLVNLAHQDGWLYCLQTQLTKKALQEGFSISPNSDALKTSLTEVKTKTGWALQVTEEFAFAKIIRSNATQVASGNRDLLRASVTYQLSLTNNSELDITVTDASLDCRSRLARELFDTRSLIQQLIDFLGNLFTDWLQLPEIEEISIPAVKA